MKRLLGCLTAPFLQRLLFWLLLLMVAYLSLKPGSSVQEEVWLPSSLGLFLDVYDSWKNAFGFGVLALSAFLGWPEGWGRKQWKLKWRICLIGLCCCTLIVIFETIQICMPGRHSDPADIIAGAIGISVAGAFSVLVKKSRLQPNQVTKSF
jgi:hypothetical protein